MMSNRKRNTFLENIRILIEELKLANRLNRPSILLAICNSSSSRVKAENELKQKLEQLNLSVIPIELNGDLPVLSQRILSQNDKHNAVFFISNINWGYGGGKKDAYYDLNMNRELLVENQIKVILWLTPQEATNLPVSAPDFWAFRHQVVEFAASRIGEIAKLPARILMWHTQDINETDATLQNRIEAYERNLHELPQTPEFFS